MISKNKTYRTRDGRRVRIYATDGEGICSVHGAVKTKTGNWTIQTWTKEGFWDSTEDIGCANDLIEVKSRIKREYWISIYDTHDVLHTTEHHAKQYNQQWIPDACVKVVIDCEEGEGL